MSQPNALLVNEQRINLAAKSLRIDRSKLRHLLEVLQERAHGAVELEFSNPILLEKTAQEIQQLKTALKEGYGLFITVTSFDGSQQLNGSVTEVFDSPNFPSDIATIFVDSSTKLRNQNYTARNSLVLFIDFRRPGIFDFNIMPSHSTENGSYFSARGLDPTWVHGVYHEVESYIGEHGVSARWLHRHSVYDVLLFILGFPIAFWMTFRASAFVHQVGSSEFLRAGLYCYIWATTLWGFRALFHYARWLWPLVEFQREGSKARAHRVFWGLLCSALFYSFASDVIKKLAGWQ